MNHEKRIRALEFLQTRKSLESQDLHKVYAQERRRMDVLSERRTTLESAANSVRSVAEKAMEPGHAIDTQALLRIGSYYAQLQRQSDSAQRQCSQQQRDVEKAERNYLLCKHQKQILAQKIEKATKLKQAAIRALEEREIEELYLQQYCQMMARIP